MAKKKLTLSDLQELSKQIASSNAGQNIEDNRGTLENPYLWEEFLCLPAPSETVTVYFYDEEGIIHKTILLPEAQVSPFQNSEDTDFPFDNSTFFEGSIFFIDTFDNSTYEETPSWEETTGGNYGGGNSTGGGTSKPRGYNDVLTQNNFKGYKTSDPQGCFRRCKEMLAEVNLEVNGTEILMCTSSDQGRALYATSNVATGIAYLNNQLSMGHPVIVCVDYKAGHTTGESWGDQAGDHFVVIVGGNNNVGYHYFDPASSHTEIGTSSQNIFTYNEGKFTSTSRCGSQPHFYTLTSIRKNK